MTESHSAVRRTLIGAAAVGLFLLPAAAFAAPGQAKKLSPTQAAHDTSQPLGVLAATLPARDFSAFMDANGFISFSKPWKSTVEANISAETSGNVTGGNGVDAALQAFAAPMLGSPIVNFDGASNQDNFNVFGGRVNPPDPVMAVGPNHIVEMINLVTAIYDKNGNTLVAPFDIGALWAGFAVPDCTDPSGDPVVLYDQFMDRWVLSQFTTRGLSNPALPFYNCVAVSATSDPTGAYYRYAFTTDDFFPDYPKYGNWTDSYVITTREFGPNLGYGIGVYALEKNKMVNGQSARVIGFRLDAFNDDGTDGPIPLNLVGDGLLPAYVDGKQKPKTVDTMPIIGTQDDGGGYGATFDALNIWDLTVKWNANASASLTLNTQLPVASFDSIFPCPGGGRRCLPQPGAATNQFLDIQSFRQRAIWRLPYRNFKDYDSILAAQSVEAAPGVGGMRWYEVRRVNGAYSLFQQGTYAPLDGVHRWMGSVAQDRQGNIGLGYSVTNATTVKPGIRFTGRLAGDALGQMTLGEGTIIDGTGIQRSTNNRWGDYTSLNLDPVDDCTMWYVNEYYTLAGQLSSTAGFNTRIASFKMPGCFAPK